ncbi:MAG: hypothetical protein PHT02_01070 [Tissierellia bacterium]|nr:hypothetical protein [Tissierellia bacterium]
MNKFLNNDNKYYNKLTDWYGDTLKNNKVEVLYVDGENEEIFAVAYILKENEQYEIARVFEIGGKMQISIDCQVDVTTTEGIKKLLQYGNQIGDVIEPFLNERLY